MLYQNGAIINSVNLNHQTPLMVSSAFNQVPVIKYLLKKGAKIEKRDKDSFTPLLVTTTEHLPSPSHIVLYRYTRPDR